MSEATVKQAVVDAALGLKQEPERPRVYLIVDAATYEGEPS